MLIISEQQIQNVINCIAAANHPAFPFQQINLLLQELQNLPKEEKNHEGVEK